MRCLLIVGLALGTALLASAQSALTYKSMVLSKGHVDFKLQPDDKGEYAQFCPSGVCTCTSDIDYVQLVGAESARPLALINKQLKADVSQSGCKYLDAVDTAHETVSYISDHFVSVVEQFVSRGIDAGGSCHGSSVVHTFDLRTGKELFVGDLISTSGLSSLKAGLASSIVTEHLRQSERDFDKEVNTNSGKPRVPFVLPFEERERMFKLASREVESYTDSKLQAEKFFIEDDRVFINAEGYYLSCADGPFHPAEIPTSLISLPSLKREISHGHPAAQRGRQ